MTDVITNKRELATNGNRLAEMWGLTGAPATASEDESKPEVSEPLEDAAIEETDEEESGAFDESDEAEADGDESEEIEGDEEPVIEILELSKDDYARLVPVTINGKTEMVPVEEAIKGYQRDKDYFRKTEELANERRAVENSLNELHKAIESNLEQGAVAVTYLRSQLPDPEELYRLSQEDPDAYVAEEAKARKVQAQIERIQNETKQSMQQYEEQQKKHVQNLKQQGIDTLKREAPHLLTDDGQRNLITFAKGMGYTEQEIRNVIDPRMLITLDEQRQFRAMKAKSLQGKKKVKQAVKQVKSSGRGEKAGGKSAELRQLKANVVNSRNKKGRNSLAAAGAYFAAQKKLNS